MGIAEKVREFIKGLLVALQNARLYSSAHRKFAQSIDAAYKQAQEIFPERAELIIGIIGDDFAFESEIFFEFASIPLAKEVMTSLKRNNIEKIIFNKYIRMDEIESFVNFLVYIQDKNVMLNGQEHLAILGIENITVDQIASPISPYEAPERKESIDLGIYEAYLEVAAKYLDALLNNQAIDYFSLRLNIFSIKANLLSMQKISRLRRAQIQSAGIVVHSANVSLLAMNSSIKLGFSREEVIEVSIAALFHDIGRLYISRRAKDSAVTDSHREEGAAILLKYSHILGQLPVVVSFEHHLKHSSKDRPGLPSKYKPHIVSELVYICDVYESLSRRIGPDYRYPPDVVYGLMLKEKGNAFNPELLDVFFRTTGIWPVGTTVLLNDGNVGVVCEENDSDITRPKVELRGTAADKAVDLKDKQELKIEKALDPFAQGKNPPG
jgi:putative nucleotidyltransferase with HDIG domain